MAKQSMMSISTQDDLCNWEFINQFDIEFEGDDNESIYEIQSIDLVESIDSLSSSSDDENEVDDVKEGPRNDVNAHDDDGARVSDLGQNLNNHVGKHHKLIKLDGFFDSRLHLNGHGYDGGNQQVDEDDDDESDDGYDMDDELVPWEVKDRFVRQRIRKSGKFSFGRTARSKKSALVFTRPGCVRGKHSLGLKVY